MPYLISEKEDVLCQVSDSFILSHNLFLSTRYDCVCVCFIFLRILYLSTIFTLFSLLPLSLPTPLPQPTLKLLTSSLVIVS